MEIKFICWAQKNYSIEELVLLGMRKNVYNIGI